MISSMVCYERLKTSFSFQLKRQYEILFRFSSFFHIPSFCSGDASRKLGNTLTISEAFKQTIFYKWRRGCLEQGMCRITFSMGNGRGTTNTGVFE